MNNCEEFDRTQQHKVREIIEYCRSHSVGLFGMCQMKTALIETDYNVEQAIELLLNAPKYKIA